MSISDDQSFSVYNYRILENKPMSVHAKEMLGKMLLEKKVGQAVKRSFSPEECQQEADNYVKSLKDRAKKVDSFLFRFGPADDVSDLFKSLLLKSNSELFLHTYHSNPVFKKAVEISFQNAETWAGQFSEAQLKAKMQSQIENLFDLASAIGKTPNEAINPHLDLLGIEGEKISRELTICVQGCLNRVSQTNVKALKEAFQKALTFQKKFDGDSVDLQFKSGARLFGFDVESSSVIERECLRHLHSILGNKNFVRWEEAARDIPAFEKAVSMIKKAYLAPSPNLQGIERMVGRLSEAFEFLEKMAGIQKKETLFACKEKFSNLVVTGASVQALKEYVETGKNGARSAFEAGVKVVKPQITNEETSVHTRKAIKATRQKSLLKTKHIESQSNLFAHERHAIKNVSDGMKAASPKKPGNNAVAMLKTAQPAVTKKVKGVDNAEIEITPAFKNVYAKGGRTGYLEVFWSEVTRALDMEDTMAPTKMSRIVVEKPPKHSEMEVKQADVKSSKKEKAPPIAPNVKLADAEEDSRTSSFQIEQTGTLANEIILSEEETNNRIESKNKLLREIDVLTKAGHPKDSKEIKKRLKEIERLEALIAKSGPSPTVHQLMRVLIPTLAKGSFDLHGRNAVVTGAGDIIPFDNAREGSEGDIIAYRGVDYICGYRPGLLLLNASTENLTKEDKAAALAMVRQLKSKMGDLHEFLKSPLALDLLDQMPKTENAKEDWIHPKAFLAAMQLRLNRMIEALEQDKVNTLCDLAFTAVPSLKMFTVLNLVLDRYAPFLEYYVKKPIVPRDVVPLFESVSEPAPEIYKGDIHKGNSGLEWLYFNCNEKGIEMRPLIEAAKDSDLAFEDAVKKAATLIYERSKKPPPTSAEKEAVKKLNLEFLNALLKRARPDWKEIAPRTASAPQPKKSSGDKNIKEIKT